MATPRDRTRRRQAPTQQATPIVGPRSQGRPSPHSGLRAAIAGRAFGTPPGFRRQPLPQMPQATGGRFGSIDETMPQPSPRFRPDLKEFFQTGRWPSRPSYPSPSGNRFGAPAEDPGLYNLYQMMMGRRRNRVWRNPEPVRDQIMPRYRVDPSIDPYPTG